MKERFIKIKTDAIPGALLSILLGVFLLIWPGVAISLLGEILAVGLILAGLFSLLGYAGKQGRSSYGVVFGVIALVIGIWMFARPYKLAELIPVILGLVVLVHGVRDLKMASSARENGDAGWWISFGLGVVSIVFGLICIVKAFSMAQMAFRLIGLMMLYDGISDMLIIRKTKQYSKKDPVDSDFREI